MEELRKKCHTDDDSSFFDRVFTHRWVSFFSALWLDQSKTLRQQDIDEQSTVVLRRKFFFSDTNIDQRDPVQLNLLYVQVSDEQIKSKRKKKKDENFCLFQLVSKWNYRWNTSSDVGRGRSILRISMSNRIWRFSRIST